ncbi:MAG: 3,4-dihydroxy-2-butanone-4-phosphate synthase [Enterobacteriaceae bacterium]
MNKNSSLNIFGTSSQRVENAIYHLKKGSGVLILDDENRENEGDIIFSAEKITVPQMALSIRYGSGIVCLCITEKKCKQLQLEMMTKNNNCKYKTAFTVSIEAAHGVTTGVSAKDRVKTIKVAVNEKAKPEDLIRPGHVFPIKYKKGGVLIRKGHTEASVDLLVLSGLKPASVICEIINKDGSMARLNDIINLSKKINIPVLCIQDIIYYIKKRKLKISDV